MKWKLLTPVLLALIVSGCGADGDQKTDKASAKVAAQEKQVNENGVSLEAVKGIKNSLEKQIQALNKGDIDKYFTYIQESEADDRESVQELIDRGATYTLKNVDARYSKDDEVLVIVEAKIMTKDYDQNNNFNQEFKDVEVYKLVGKKWTHIGGSNISVAFLDESGKPSNLFPNTDNTEVWETKINKIKADGLLPSDYLKKEEEVFTQNDELWERMNDIFLVENAEELRQIITETFLHPDEVMDNYLDYADDYISNTYTDTKTNIIGAVITSLEDKTATYTVHIQNSGTTPEGTQELFENTNFEVKLGKNDKGKWKFISIE